MKTLKYILIAFALSVVGVACNPMEDINTELENEFSGPKEIDLEYTLEYADYTTISSTAAIEATTVDEYKLATQVAVDTVLYPEMSSAYIPYLLNNNDDYIGYGKGSTITVTFNAADAIGESKAATTEMFVVGENLTWQAPSVISFAFVQSDYQALTEYVKAGAELTKYWESTYIGREVYYGSSAKYSNFDMRYSTRAIETDGREATLDPILVELYNSGDYVALDDKLADRALEGMMLMLEMKYAESGANIKSNGTTITYEVRSLWFKEGMVNQYVTCKYECTKASPNAKFTLIEGPIYE